ncbi:MAG: translation initiation factor 2 [Clostridiales bacterium]|nr:translation initiation factor 2 [Clostridiales bacterium]
MKGKYRVVIQTSRIKYDFMIRRNITVITGNSATGKTTLIEMIADYQLHGTASGITLECDKHCEVLADTRWELILSDIKDSIVFIDEESSFVKTKRFAELARQSDNYYVIVSRERLAQLPYSVEEIYGIRETGRYSGLRQTYNEMYQLYGNFLHGELAVAPELVITEDTNAGYEFFSDICRVNKIECLTAGGKSNVCEIMLKYSGERITLAIVDGAAFGAEMEKMMSEVNARNNFFLYTPESFEWLILQSSVLNHVPGHILNHPEDYIASENYFSWEQFFTHLLTELTRKHAGRYSKKKLNPFYLSDTNKRKILGNMHGIKFSH